VQRVIGKIWAKTYKNVQKSAKMWWKIMAKTSKIIQQPTKNDRPKMDEKTIKETIFLYVNSEKS
jgi:hypothetical protein